MSKPVSRTMIGLFVIGAVALIVVAVGVLGSGRFFKEKITYFMVFDGSIKGLNAGAPLVFRGVKVGAVSDTKMNFDYASKTITVLVYADFDKARLLAFRGQKALAAQLEDKSHYTVMQELIDQGLRAQLEVQSFVTGQLEIALDFYPDRSAVFTGIDKNIMEIPTIPTSLQEWTKRLENLPIEDIFLKIQSTAEGMSRIIHSTELKDSLTNLNGSLRDLQSLIRNVDSHVTPLVAGLSQTIQDTQKLVRNMDAQVAALGPNLNETIGEGRKLIQRTGASVDAVQGGLLKTLEAATAAIQEAEKGLEDLQAAARMDSLLMYRITESLSEVEKTARSLRALTDYLERYPESLLRGK